METISTIRGSTIQLLCIATGFPLPSIKWLKDGEPVSSIGKDNHKSSETGLQISNVDSTDAGQYICRAKNGIGTAKEKLFEVRIIGKVKAQWKAVGAKVDCKCLALWKYWSHVITRCQKGFPVPNE